MVFLLFFMDSIEGGGYCCGLLKVFGWFHIFMEGSSFLNLFGDPVLGYGPCLITFLFGFMEIFQYFFKKIAMLLVFVEFWWCHKPFESFKDASESIDTPIGQNFKENSKDCEMLERVNDFETIFAFTLTKP